MSKDRFGLAEEGLDSPCTEQYTITPGTNYLAQIPRCLYIAVAGNLVIEDSRGVQITYVGVDTGIFPFRAARVLSGTTATVIGWF